MNFGTHEYTVPMTICICLDNLIVREMVAFYKKILYKNNIMIPY